MKTKILSGLVALNVVLAVCLAGRLLRPSTAQAQVRGRPADYIMVPGEIIGGPSDVVYVVDTTNGVLGAMTYDDTQHRLDVMQPINLNTIFQRGAGGR